jgi:hypothetical protein
VGTREHIIGYLTEVNELIDASGMASTQLAVAVDYPGSSVAFAQLLSGMERSGLIQREVRGKRTYRISLGRAQAMGPGRPAGWPGVDGRAEGAGVDGRAVVDGARVTGSSDGAGGRTAAGLETGGQAGGIQAGGIQAGGAQAGGAQAGGAQAGGGQADGVQAGGVQAGGFDYDELARRLLVQVARRLAATEPEAGRGDSSALQETVTGLEYELATAWTKHGKLAEENVRLREQLRAAQRSLALAAERVRRLPVSTDLDNSEVVLLQRLLASGSSDSSDREAENARSLLS